jgi:hypothetical protein
MDVGNKRLHDLFESHTLHQQKPYLDYLLEMEAEGMIEISEVSYTPSGNFEWFLQGSDRERSIESPEHRRLKRLVASYLHETGCESVGIEVQTWFGRADVGCTKSSRYAECGKVRAEKFLQAFGRETNVDLLGKPSPNYKVSEELLYVPYKPNEQSNSITMISFKSQEG